jgi:LmbE family N-acetylglucosaminyl deacetylase
VWISLTHEPGITIDVTPFWQKKLKALLEHKSQIGDPDQFLEKMASRRMENSTVDHPRYEEGFRRLFQR